MPPIRFAEDAVNTAERFLRKYHSFYVLRKVLLEKDKWFTEFDVSIMGPEKIVRITLDADTGNVVAFDRV